MYRDTPEGHSWLSVFKICRMMCPKCTRRNSMLPSSFKREKRWQNADMEMNSFSIARIPIPRRQEYKNVFHFPDTNINADRKSNKNIFPFPGYHYKNADLKSIHFFFFFIARI
jgi:hypothetical protein